jgi:hypothetical protein
MRFKEYRDLFEEVEQQLNELSVDELDRLDEEGLAQKIGSGLGGAAQAVVKRFKGKSEGQKKKGKYNANLMTRAAPGARADIMSNSIVNSIAGEKNPLSFLMKVVGQVRDKLRAQKMQPQQDQIQNPQQGNNFQK